MSDLAIRQAEMADIPALELLYLEMLGELAEYDYDILPTLANARVFSSTMLRPSISIGTPNIVAERDAKLAGAAFFIQYGPAYSMKERVLVDRGIYVRPEYRGMGIHGRMMRMAKETAKEKGFESIYMMVDNRNKAGLAAALGCGWAPVGQYGYVKI